MYRPGLTHIIIDPEEVVLSQCSAGLCPTCHPSHSACPGWFRKMTQLWKTTNLPLRLFHPPRSREFVKFVQAFSNFCFRSSESIWPCPEPLLALSAFSWGVPTSPPPCLRVPFPPWSPCSRYPNGLLSKQVKLYFLILIELKCATKLKIYIYFML